MFLPKAWYGINSSLLKFMKECTDFLLLNQLVFYGYCGSNYEDAVAIDNIFVESSTYTTQAPASGKKLDQSIRRLFCCVSV